ncbi:SRPBCC family protein [Mesorhizobium helmanticense]|uniref:Coenzyme Q-binding protein COQ10 START domain-containing protein n=1 Tax=Mesorhizobium helmanticense TaxID=1776423 RepID=A0A2T4ILX8_9HYPH|nr:SRPBCC family protein [Mesorhizobium helmanticense]PTE06657.1 hypothetical protein C9427_30485 [Mesorhizobium helmanticense]
MRKTAVVERVFGADIREVFQGYWDIKNWPRALSSVVDACTEYDDDTHQYFSMIALNGDARETISGVRIGTPYQRLEMCQFVSPPGFTLMRGEWRFSPILESGGSGTRVSAQREFALSDPGREAATSLVLEALLARNLAAFDAYLNREAA